VLFDLNCDGVADHIGIVENILPEKTPGGRRELFTIEGNAAGAVRRKVRKVDETVLGVFRPNYGVENEAKGDDAMNDETTRMEPSGWAEEAWAWAAVEGLMDGSRPHDAVTREELATVLLRLCTLEDE
jgi:hypothetical protein